MSGREFSKKTGSCWGGGGGDGGDGGDEEGVGGWGGRASGERRYRNRRKWSLEEGEGHIAPIWQDRGLIAGVERSWRRKRRRAGYGPGRGGKDTNRDGEGVAMNEPLLRSEREGRGIRRRNDGSEDS